MFLSIFGYGVAASLFFGMLWRQAFRWRYLARHYDRPAGEPVETRSMQSAVLMGLSGFNTLKGIIKIGVHENGVSFRLMAPFSLFHDPLFIPYRDITGWKTTWYLDARSTELQFRGAPDVKMIVPATQAEWIQGFAGHTPMLRDTSPPEGKAGRGWYAFALSHAAISLVMLVVLAAVLVSKYLAGEFI